MIAEYEGGLSIEALCEAYDVSPSGYYAWCKREPSQHQKDDNRLGGHIEQLFGKSRSTYGSFRLYQTLQQIGVQTSHKRVARLMRERSLRSIRARKRRVGLTQAARNRYVMPNHLKQDFKATYCNEKWVADTTYIPTHEGWLYLVSIVDLFSRQVVGWAMGEQHDATLAHSALDMALRRHQPQPGVILHSDRGSEFANQLWYNRAKHAEMKVSMSGKGNCYDNAVAESFFATLKLEAVHCNFFTTKQAARAALFDYIEVFYNRQRIHSSLGFMTPAQAAA